MTNMNKKNILNSDKGESLVMILVAVALAAGVALGISQMSILSIRASKVASNSSDFENISQEIMMTIEKPSTCAGFAKDAEGNSVKMAADPAAHTPLNEFRSGAQPLFKVGDLISAGTKITRVELVPTTLPDEPINITMAGILFDRIRSMRLEVEAKRSDDSLGEKILLRKFPVRVYVSATNDVGTCEQVQEDAGSVGPMNATGKIDWVRKTRFSTRESKSKFVGSFTEECQSVSGTGRCQIVPGQTGNQRAMVQSCSDGRQGFTLFRGSKIVNPPHNDYIEETFTTYCSVDPNQVSINLQPANSPSDALGIDPTLADIDGESVSLFCYLTPNSPICSTVTPPAPVASNTTTTTMPSNGGGSGNSGTGSANSGSGNSGTGSGGGGGGGGGCFPAGTAITMADGSLENIESIKSGDQVISYDEERDQLYQSTVVAILHHPAKEQIIFNLKFASGRSLAVNDNHPIYLVELKRYVNSKYLIERFQSGRSVTLLDQSGAQERLVGVDESTARIPVYNFHVSGRQAYSDKRGIGGTGHNYFANGILVHNVKSIDPGITADVTRQ
jgi:uncharacterized membrane protein YgcG